MVETPLLKEPRHPNEMICVCCNCKRERDAFDEWHDHTPQPGERLTHGICPTCLRALYPEIAPLVLGD